MKLLHAWIRTQGCFTALAAIFSLMSLSLSLSRYWLAYRVLMRSKTLSLNINLKKSTGTMLSVLGMAPASVVNTGGPEINCFVLSLPVGGVGLSRRVVRVGLAVGEIVLSCMGEWVGLLHS